MEEGAWPAGCHVDDDDDDDVAVTTNNFSTTVMTKTRKGVKSIFYSLLR